MARRQSGRVLHLLTGVGTGFLAALLWLDPPASGDGSEPRERQAAQQPDSGAAREPWPARVRREPANAPTTLAAVLELEGEFAQTAALYELLRTADEGDLKRLSAEADGLSNALDRRAALAIVYARWADLDPEGALVFLQNGDPALASVGVPALFHGWARRDLQAAVTAAAGLPDALRERAGVSILQAREELAGDARRDIARRLSIQHVLAELDTQRLLEQLDTDPAAAWQAALAEASGPMRLQLLGSVVRKWAQQDPRAALTAVTALSNPTLRQPLEQQVVHRWAEREPQAAVDWVMSQSPSPQQAQLAAMALNRLASSDPNTAFAIAESLQGQAQANALQQVLSAWAQQDPAAAADAAEQITSRQARHGALFSIGTAYARSDPQGALQWAQRLNGQEGRMAVSMVFNVMAQQDPLDAAAHIGVLSDEGLQAQATAAVASAWAQRDPPAAARWAENLTDDGLRRMAIGNVSQMWSHYDRPSALRHAESLALPADRDAAFLAMLQAQPQDAEFAGRVFERISDPEQRAAAARLLYFTLREVDPRQAQRYRELAGSIEPGAGWAPAAVDANGAVFGINR